MYKENTPAGAMTGATEHGAVGSGAHPSGTGLETELLRALLAAPAAHVCATVARLDRADLHSEHHRLILAALVCRARAQLATGDGGRPVPPTVVQLDLQQSGDLAVDAVRTVLLDTVTGTPMPVEWLDDLLTGLRQARLRRAYTTVGTTLVEAGRNGSTDDLERALTHIPALLAVAARAGLRPEGQTDDDR